MRRALFAAIAMFLLAGCSDGPSEPEMCPAEITAQVVIAGDAPPEFRWAPDCPINHISVTTEARDQVMWYLSAPAGGFSSGVVYGSTPRGAIQIVPAEPLVAGESYFLSLGTLVGDDAVYTHALKQFTR